MTPAPAARVSYAGLTLLFVVAVTAVRLAGLSLSRVDLYVDEAQYWSWAQSPAWGYFSKPPLIAWLAAAAQAACGAGEACVRAPAALAWGLTGVMTFAVGAALYDARAGFWAALLTVLAPGAVFSGRILSTDAPLLLFWSAALLAFVRLRRGDGPGWGLLFGAALGLGLLTKYAMAYLPACLGLAAAIDPASRRVFRGPGLWLGLGLAALVVAPHLAWQATHGLVTVRHTAGNAADAGPSPGLDDGLAFLVSQFAVLGPVVFAVLLTQLGTAVLGRGLAPEDRLMLAVSAPVVAVVTCVALVTEANANWAAPALVGAAVLTSAVLLRRRARGWLIASAALGLAVQALLLAGDASADRLSVAGRDPYARSLGWRALAATAAARAGAAGAPVVVADHRAEIAALLYYGRETGLAVRAWPADGPPRDHFQMSRPLRAGEAPVLALSRCDAPGRFRGWRRVERLAPAEVRTGPTSARRWFLFRLSAPDGPPRPPLPCP